MGIKWGSPSGRGGPEETKTLGKGDVGVETAARKGARIEANTAVVWGGAAVPNPEGGGAARSGAVLDPEGEKEAPSDAANTVPKGEVVNTVGGGATNTVPEGEVVARSGVSNAVPEGELVARTE